MNTFDLIVLGIIAASALFAFLRGFVRESLGIVAWVGAILGAWYFDAPLAPAFKAVIPSPWLANLVEPVLLFILFLIVLSVITGVVSARVRRSSLGSADRALGLLFGLARGVLVVCLAGLVLDKYVAPDARPQMLRDARSLPLIESGAAALEGLVPRSVVQQGGEEVEKAIDKAGQAERLQHDLDEFTGQSHVDAAKPAPAKPGGAPPAGAEDRQRLNQLFQQAEDGKGASTQ